MTTLHDVFAAVNAILDAPDLGSAPDDLTPDDPPSEADRRWWAEQNEDWDDPDGPEPDCDTLAGEAEAQDRLEAGCLL